MKRIPAKRVVVVDDEPNIGLSLQLILEREGYAVSICHSAGEARAWGTRADAFMVDVRLPDASGMDVLRHIRAAEAQV